MNDNLLSLIHNNISSNIRTILVSVIIVIVLILIVISAINYKKERD